MTRKWFFLFSILFFTTPSLLIANEKFYAGIGIGAPSFSLNQNQIVSNYSQLTSNADMEDSTVALRAFAGMKFDEHLSGEIDYTFAGSIVANESSTKHKLFDVNLFSIDVALSNSLSENIDYYGKLGVHVWDLVEKTESGTTLDNDLGIKFGLGIDINLYGDNSRRIRLDWTHYEFDDVYLSGMDLLSVNILFSFGNI